MKILIAGGDGQVGKALLATALQTVSVEAYGRASLDITDRHAIDAVLNKAKPDVIINAAAYTAVDAAETDQSTAEQINGHGVKLLAASANDLGAKLVQISTDFVFDGTASEPYSVKSTTGPLSTYGRTKLAGEHAALAFSNNLVVRTAWVYAASSRNFVTTMLRLMQEREQIRVVSDQIGSPTHAESLARAIWSLVEGDAVGIFHFTNAGLASWYDFAVAIQEEALALGILSRAIAIVPIRSEDFPTPAKRPSFAVLDKAETDRFLNTTPTHWRVELRHMLAQLKDQHYA